MQTLKEAMHGTSITRTLTIQNQRGLHARAAAKFVKLAGSFSATITVSKDGMTVAGSSIMGLMMLAAGIGSEVVLAVCGEDAGAAMDAICRLVDDKFDEE